MFDKIQSTYFKRVTTGVLALFMTASSGFSYAVPVYAEEVTTAAAKRKKEEEFSSTESSTLQLNENSTKEEVKKSKEEASTNATTEAKKLINDGIKETINKAKNQSSRPQEKISEDTDQNNSSEENSFREMIKNEKESGRKLSDQKAQENLTNIMDRKQYTFDKIVQNILEINDFSYYSKLTKDDISFLMNGTSIQDYEIVELMALKSAVFYDSCGEKKEKLKDFYSGVAKYLNLIDECKNQKKSLTRNEKQKIEDECLSIMNGFYDDEDIQWKTHKDFQDYLTANLSKNKKIYYDQMLKYIEDDELSKDKVEDMKNDQTTLKKSSGKKSSKSDKEIELPEYTEMYNQESWSNGFSIDTSELINSLRTADSVKTSGYCYLKIDETNTNFGGKGDSKIKINVSYNKSDNGNKTLTWARLRDSATTWRVSIDSSSSGLANNHGISIPNRVTTKKDDVKNSNNKYSYFVFPFQVTYKQPQYYKLCNNSEGGPTDYLDRETNNIRLNFDDYDRSNNGASSLTYGVVKSDTPRTVTYQVNAAFFGVKTYNGSYLKHPTGVLRYMRPKYRMDVNGLLDGTESGSTNGYGKFSLRINGNIESGRQNKDDIWEEFYYGTPYSIEGVSTDSDRIVYKGASQGSTSGTIWGDTTVQLKFVTCAYLDLNGVLDGSQKYNLTGFGTADIYINGNLYKPSAEDFYELFEPGTAWSVVGHAKSGYHYHQDQSVNVSGTMGSNDMGINLVYTSGSTLSIDPNGGTYKGSSGVTTVNNLSPGATITVDSPTRPGYKFGGYDTSHGDYQYFASNNGWTTSHGENVGTYSRSYDGNVSLNEAPDGGYYRTNHVWRGIDSATDNYNCISFPTYTAQAGHTYKISGEVWISERPSGGSFALNFYHGDSSNDWKHCMWGISEGWTGKWVKFSMERTFDTTTNDARFEIWTSDLKGLTGNISFWLQGLKITDETTGNDVSMTKIAMGNSDIKLTARWIPLHSTLSYDAQGGSLDSVKSTDNPNNYKIVDNGDYFIQSGLNSSRYLHDYDCSRENGAKVCTFQGYGANAKQCIWTFERYKNTPYYYIINKYNGKALNLSGDGPGTRDGSVEMWTQLDGSNAAQSDFLWYFKDAGDGYITICNKLTDKALDIPNGEDNDNVKLQQYTPNGTASQKFKLVQSEDNYVTTSVVYNGKYLTATGSSNSTGCAFTDKKILWKVRRRGRERYFENEYSDTYTLEDTTTGLKLNAVYYNGRYIIFNNQYDELCYNNGNLWMEYDDDEKDQYSISVQLADADPSSLPSSNISMTLADFPTREKYTDSNVYINSATPVKKGCKFLGWNTKEDGSGKTYQPGDLYDVNQDGGNATLYAQWEKAKYNINVKLNGGTLNDGTYNSLKDFSIVKYAGDKFNIGIPTKEKNNFLGWTPNTLNGDAPTDFTANKSGTMVTSKHKEQTGTYESGYDQNSSQALYVDGAIWNNVQNTSSTSKYNTVQSGKMKLKAGHTYKVMGGLIVKGLTDSSGNSIAANVNLRLRSNSNQKVSESDCTKISSNGTSCRPSFEITPKSDIDDATFEISVEIPSGTKATRLLLTYEFGIVDTTTGVEGVGTEAEGTMGEGNFTLTAQWAPWKHTVRYDANAKNDTSVKGIPASQSKTANVDIKLNAGVPTRNGYTFLGWNTKADGKGTAYAAGAIYKNDQNGGTVTLYAVWTPWKYKVQYDKNVSADSSSQTVSNMPTDQTKTEEVVLTLSSNKPNRNGYIFNGWQAQINGKAVDYQPGAKLSYDVDDKDGSTIILKAQWTPWKHTVHYDANGGDQSSVPNDQKKTYEQNMNVATKVPTRNEYKFLGWKAYHEYNDKSGNKHSELIGNYQPGASYNYDIDETGQYAADNGEYNKCGTVTMKAQWVQLYTVKYDGNQPAIKGVTVTGSVANQTQGQDESVNLRTNNFKNDSGVYKNWSVGKDAYKYGKLDGKIREFIHPEGFKTNHSTMQNEYTGYEGQIKLIHS